MSDFQPTYSKGDRVSIVVSTGYGTVTGRIIEQLVDWWAIDQSVGAFKRTTWVQRSHVVTIHKTEEQ